MNPVWMILSSLAGVGALSGVFFAQASMRRRRVARRRMLREKGKLPSLQSVAGESQEQTDESPRHPSHTLDVRG